MVIAVSIGEEVTRQGREQAILITSLVLGLLPHGCEVVVECAPVDLVLQMVRNNLEKEMRSNPEIETKMRPLHAAPAVCWGCGSKMDIATPSRGLAR